MMTKEAVQQYVEIQAHIINIASLATHKIFGNTVEAPTSAGFYGLEEESVRFHVWVGTNFTGIEAPAAILWDISALEEFCAAYESQADKEEREEFDRLREKFCGKPCDGD